MYSHVIHLMSSNVIPSYTYDLTYVIHLMSFIPHVIHLISLILCDTSNVIHLTCDTCDNLIHVVI